MVRISKGYKLTEKKIWYTEYFRFRDITFQIQRIVPDMTLNKVTLTLIAQP